MLNLASIFTPSELPPGPVPSPAQILSAKTLDEAVRLTAAVVQDCFQPVGRVELFLREGEELRPLVHRGSGAAESLKLLASARARLLGRHELLTDAEILPSSAARRDRALMVVPVGGTTDPLVGVLLVEAGPRRADFGRAELVALEAIAALLSTVLARVRGADSDDARARIDLDRRAARSVQRGFMAGSLPPGIGVSAQAEYLPAFDVGGDFYSIRQIGEHEVGVAIGDVSGNGVSAALVMSRVASDIERGLVDCEPPAALLGRVNEQLGRVEGETFVTAACLHLDTRSRRVRLANAGHLPLVIRRADGETFACGGASGLPLGLFPGQYFEEELALEPSDIVLLMTDGLLEALDHPTGHRGMQLLLAELRGIPHELGAVRALVRRIVEHARRDQPGDDVTAVALQLASA